MAKTRKNAGTAPDEYYHIFNRGALKRKIFLDLYDYARFLFLLLHLQSPDLGFENIGRHLGYFMRHRVFNISADQMDELTTNRYVTLIAFNLRPNHFHLIVKEEAPAGIPKFLQRLGNSHAKYFNRKNESSGHLFQGKYQSVRIESNDQLLYTSAYIHKHEATIDYEWSSYRDYVKENRWPRLLDTSLILDQFSSAAEYHEWVKASGAKQIVDQIDVPHQMLNN